MSEMQNGWTDDMSVPLSFGQNVDVITNFVIQQALAGAADDENERRLIREFDLSPGNAALIRDRVFGGIVRAATGNKANRPNQKKDPFAHASFDQASRDPSIIAAIYPQFVQPSAAESDIGQPKKRPWWRF